MGSVESVGPYLEPIRKSVLVPRTPAEAFEIFTKRFGAWWPRQQFSLQLQNCAECGIEPRVGGEVYEISNTGERGVWGKVLAWEPAGRLLLSWHPGDPPENATELEFRFIAVAGGTRVELEHRDWAKTGEKAAKARASYEGGWATVFDICYLEACQ